MSRTLDEWLAYQQTIHARGIDLGLDRVREVWQRLGGVRPAPVVITVGGTNGKGSTLAFLTAMLRAGGMRVGAYTSPHALRYNERVCVDGMEAEDRVLVDAFGRVEAARGEVPLTYFEFGTLAAFDVFARAGVEVALLEVGLGGRLDAVNLVDADCAIVVTVDLDHMEYLGSDREAIGWEKAGIFRADRPAIVAEADPPASVLEHARAIGAELRVLERDYGWSSRTDGLHWWCRGDAGAGTTAPAGGALDDVVLREPLSLEGDFQYRNAAAAVAALHALGRRVRWDAGALTRSHAGAAPLPGRLQHLGDHPDIVLDVGHNPQAARALAHWLDRHPVAGVTRAVFGALADKQVEALAAALGSRIAVWYLAGLADESPRGETTAAMMTRVLSALPRARAHAYPDIARAFTAARAEAGETDRILAFGSFHVVAPILRACGG